MPEGEPLSPRKTAVVLIIVIGCFAVLWPRLLQPALLGKTEHDPVAPNKADRAQGCCDVIFEKDVNAIEIMIELCSSILEKNSGPLNSRTASAFATRKLPPDIIRTCRLEVNATCGVDISTFLQQNVKLGKTYKQILDEVRSYNSSACLKMHYGVPTWALGSGHSLRTWNELEIESVKQERPPHTRGPSPHPAMLERGRAIPPERAPDVVRRAPEVVRRAEGRVRSPLSVYYEETEPPPVPGMRPPMGGAGGSLPPPKSSMGLVMPVYTLCIVVFFVYTLCKILFKRTDSTAGNYETVTPDPQFRSRVFEDRRTSRASPETKLVVSAISGLVAEVQQQMETSYAQSRVANGAQVTQPENDASYTNGTLNKSHDASPVRIIAKEFRQVYSVPEEIEPKDILNAHAKIFEPEDKIFEVQDNTLKLDEKLNGINNFVSENQETICGISEVTPVLKGSARELKDTISELKGVTQELRETISELKETTPEPTKYTPENDVKYPELKEATLEPTIYNTENELKHPEIKEKVSELIKTTLEPTKYTPDVELGHPELEEATLNPKKYTSVIEQDFHEKETDETLEKHLTTNLLAAEIQKEDLELEKQKEERDEDIYAALSEEEIEYEVEDDEEESPIVRQLRASVEKDNATVKVLGMETTAHCEGGEVWGDRPLSPPVPPRPAPSPLARPHEAAEVSSIFLSGDIPQQSRLLVADSHTDSEPTGKDSPVVLSGKMTLSLINDDDAKSTPERDLESPLTLDEDYTTASAYTQPKLNPQPTRSSGNKRRNHLRRRSKRK